MSCVQDDFDSLVPATGTDRRTFLMAGVGFALATQPVMAPTAVSTPEEGLIAGEVVIPIGEEVLQAYRAAPERSGTPVVLVVSEIFGVHEYIRDICRRLAKLGYFAVAPALFSRQGDPARLQSIPEILDKITNRTSDAQVIADLDACVSWAAAQNAGVERLFVTGFCWGGRITWLYSASNPNVRAGVAWYGRLTGPVNDVTPSHPIQRAPHLHAPVLGLYGGQDAGIPLDTVETMRNALLGGSTAAKASQIHVYPEAPHAFHADYRPGYRKNEAEDGWKRMLAWFDNAPSR